MALLEERAKFKWKKDRDKKKKKRFSIFGLGV